MLFRTTTKDHEACGYEVTLDAREQRLSLRRLAGEATVLAQTTAEIPMARRVPLKIQFEGARLRVWLGNDLQPVLDATDPKPWLVAGQVGIRSWGSALSVDDLILYPGHELAPGGMGHRPVLGGDSPSTRAQDQRSSSDEFAVRSTGRLVARQNGPVVRSSAPEMARGQIGASPFPCGEESWGIEP